MANFKQRKTLASLAGALLLLLTYSPVLAQGKQSPSSARRITLWVQEVNGTPLYWVGDTPAGRAPLSGLVKVIKPGENIRVTVILDSRVPIQEMGEINGVLAKIPVEDAQYYVYDPTHPSGMSEIIWRSEFQALPAPPPH